MMSWDVLLNRAALVRAAAENKDVGSGVAYVHNNGRHKGKHCRPTYTLGAVKLWRLGWVSLFEMIITSFSRTTLTGTGLEIEETMDVLLGQWRRLFAVPASAGLLNCGHLHFPLFVSVEIEVHVEGS